MAIARGALRDSGAVSRALERALDAAEVEGVLLRFLLIHAKLGAHSRTEAVDRAREPGLLSLSRREP